MKQLITSISCVFEFFGIIGLASCLFIGNIIGIILVIQLAMTVMDFF